MPSPKRRSRKVVANEADEADNWDGYHEQRVEMVFSTRGVPTNIVAGKGAFVPSRIER